MKRILQNVVCGVALGMMPQLASSQWAVAPQAFQWQTVNCMYFVGNTGYAGGETGATSKTTNGGATWTPMTNFATGSMTAAYFLDANTGFMTSQAQLWKTTNGGAAWSLKHSLNNQQFQDVEFTSATTGFAVGGEGGVTTMLKTTNAGESWTAVTTPSIGWIWDVDFPTPNVGYAVAIDGNIIKTTDGGTTWTEQTSGTSVWLRSVSFVDASTGYTVGDDNVILKTINGGSTWTAMSSGVNLQMRDVHFINATTGYIAAYDANDPSLGKILKTTNGGTSWAADYTGATGMLWTLAFPSPTAGYAGGIIGNMVKMSGTVGLNEEAEEMVIAYPNPSASGLFQLKGLSETSVMEVRNMSGQLVMTPATAEIDLSSFNSGVYFLSVTNETKTSVIRLIKD
jgi:photosystem II stability/assembly factor-like uncharacterized protein